MAPPCLSIVIPTFNRRHLIGGAIQSALDWADRVAGTEVIVVDDASTDGSAEWIASQFFGAIRSKALRLIRLPVNIGVTGAKNAGAVEARGDWIIFLDSDDQLIPDVAEEMREFILLSKQAPVIFFRAQDMLTEAPIGMPIDEPFDVHVSDLLGEWKWGDCLPVARRSALNSFPYETELRGYEGLTWLRMARSIGPIRIGPLVVVRVRTVGADRLTGRAVAVAQACLRARGSWRMLLEFGSAMPLKTRARYIGAWGRAAFLCVALKRLGRRRRAAVPEPASREGAMEFISAAAAPEPTKRRF